MTEPNEERNLAALPIFTNPAHPATVWGPPQPAPAPRGPGGHLLAAAGAVTASPAETPAAPQPVAPPATALRAEAAAPEIDWATVAMLREEVSKQLSLSIEAHPSMTEADERALAQTHTYEVIRAHVEKVTEAAGDSMTWSSHIQQQMAKAVMDALFGLGRLQPLVEQPLVENIDINGFDNVWVKYADGRKELAAPIASSDKELIEEMRFLASRGGESGRPFTPSHPILSMDLPGGIGRLEAIHPPIAPRPKVVMRIHRFVDITLGDLVKLGTIPPVAAGLLAAMIKAGKSIVVSGHPGVGKTTLVRALCNVIDPEEEIVTIEKERELHLDKMGDKHKIVTALQYRPGQGERAADGTLPGEVSLVMLLESSLRLDAQRIVVGEVRGGEIEAMFQAMQAGVGSLSTLHADSATNAIERMATLTQANLNTSDSYAYRQIAQHIDFIVQISKFRTEDGGIRRMVTEIAEIQPGEGGRPVASPVFGMNRNGELEYKNMPTRATRDELEAAGLNLGRVFRTDDEGAA